MTVPIADGVWLDHDGRHDTRSGVDVVTPLTPDERRQVIAATLAQGIAELHDLMAVAEQRHAQATTLQAAAAARAATVAQWVPQVEGATDLATLKARTVADTYAVRAEVAGLHQRDADTLTGIAETYAGLVIAYRDLAYLGTLASEAVD